MIFKRISNKHKKYLIRGYPKKSPPYLNLYLKLNSNNTLKIEYPNLKFVVQHNTPPPSQREMSSNQTNPSQNIAFQNSPNVQNANANNL